MNAQMKRTIRAIALFVFAILPVAARTQSIFGSIRGTAVDNTGASTFGQLTAATTAENAGNRRGQLARRLDF